MSQQTRLAILNAARFRSKRYEHEELVVLSIIDVLNLANEKLRNRQRRETYARVEIGQVQGGFRKMSSLNNSHCVSHSRSPAGSQKHES